MAVRVEPQKGHATGCACSTASGRPREMGAGAMPKPLSRARPSGVMRSVDQIGSKTKRTSTCATPGSCSKRSRTCRPIRSRAGQPVNVGRISTVTRPSLAASTRCTIPMSTTLTAGISGSTTSRSAAQSVSRGTVVLPATALPPFPETGSRHGRHLGVEGPEVLADRAAVPWSGRGLYQREQVWVEGGHEGLHAQAPFGQQGPRGTRYDADGHEIMLAGHFAKQV